MHNPAAGRGAPPDLRRASRGASWDPSTFNACRFNLNIDTAHWYPLSDLLLPASQAFALSAFHSLLPVDSLVPASQAFARSTFHSLPQPAAQPQSSAVHHYTTRTYNSAARPPGLPLPALVSRTARVLVAATALNRSAPQFCWLPLQTRLALARGLVGGNVREPRIIISLK